MGTVQGQPENGKALATLYSALMLDQLLTNLAAKSDVVIEGSFASNDLLCSVLAALRPEQKVHQLRTSGGVISGCFASMTPEKHKPLNLSTPVAPADLPGLKAYADEWRTRVMAMAAPHA